jgi:predicted dehydrogenase
MIKNYCIVGTGHRAMGMFAKDMIENYSDYSQITGLCDINLGRVEWAQKELGVDVPVFTDFEEMLKTVTCDTVIVTTRDTTHDYFINTAMRYGKDVITEKPMTINDEKCRSILATQQETGKDMKVTFNYRYAPYKTKIKELLREGIIGDIHSVEFRWFLDTVHGADYFRRWHRNKENSGGLLVHKSTHHFDLVNWWMDLEPQEVVALGSRHYYVSERKPGHGERCLSCSIKKDCEFYMDISEGKFKAPYFENEQYDGYYRDQCVFSEDIDIEDTMSVLVRYPRNIQLTYALTAATSFEGWQVAFNGSKGRLEAFEPEYFITEENQVDFEGRDNDSIRRRVDWRSATTGDKEQVQTYQIRFYPLFGGVQTINVPYSGGGHGGGDRRLKDHLFIPGSPDPLGHAAGSRAGAMSILVGVAANKSMQERRVVTIEELLAEPAKTLTK